MPQEVSPWSPYEPTPADPWDLRKVTHLHRRIGFGATWSELQRDLRNGPEASVRPLLDPPPQVVTEPLVLGALRQGARTSGEMDRLKSYWLWRVLYADNPLVEKMTLFWHSHFATSDRKVQSLDLMLGQNETLRQQALGEYADLLNAIVIDPAMLIWLDGEHSRRDRPNENLAREFLELFTLGTGHYRETDVREAARALTGWSRMSAKFSLIRQTPRLRFDAAAHDDGVKTFLGQTGQWNAGDIVRITLEQPAAAEFLCRKLYRAFLRDEGDLSADLIRPLAEELSATTDAQGQFELHGLRANWHVALKIDDERFGPQEFIHDPLKQVGDKGFVAVLAPKRILEGVVTSAEDGKPVPNTELSIATAESNTPGVIWYYVESRADERGRFRVALSAGKYARITAHAPPGSPSLGLSKSLSWPESGVLKQEMNLALEPEMTVNSTSLRIIGAWRRKRAT